MTRTFDGKTKAFQKIVREMLAGKMWVAAPENALKVIVLTGNSTHSTWSEIPVSTNTATPATDNLEARANRVDGTRTIYMGKREFLG